MQCTSCHEPAGFLRRLCPDCLQVFAVYEEHRGELGLSQLLDLFIARGIPRPKIEAALAADPDGTGALRDRITADMANRLLVDMGMAPRQTAANVRRLRDGATTGASTTRPVGDAAPPRERR